MTESLKIPSILTMVDSYQDTSRFEVIIFIFPHPFSRHTSIHFPTKLAVDASWIGLLSGLVATSTTSIFSKFKNKGWLTNWPLRRIERCNNFKVTISFHNLRDHLLDQWSMVGIDWSAGVWLGYSAWLYWTDGKLTLGDLETALFGFTSFIDVM